MKKIQIKKSQTADTRTCDWSKVSKEQLLASSKFLTPPKGRENK